MKIVKKLLGKARGMAKWATTIGTEDNVILISVITDSESMEALK